MLCPPVDRTLLTAFGHDLSESGAKLIRRHIDAVLLHPGEKMHTNCHSSPLQHLAAFAIVFVATVVGTMVVGAYVESLTSDAQRG